jgi:transcriptional regulator with XRE-family HTH domain
MISPKDFRSELAARVKLAREAAGFTQQEVSDVLGVPQTTYHKYEAGRATPMPHHLIHKFCLLTRVSEGWLMSGEGKAPFRPLMRRRGT